MAYTSVLGQPKAATYLQQLAARQRVPGALLFHGPDGVGKRKMALEFAKALVCEDASGAKGISCGVCGACQAVDKGTHPDITVADFVYQARLNVKKEADEEELEKEIAKQQHLSVETVRRLAALSQQKAAWGGWKVLIIDQAQTLTREAANALLKFIEEPPTKTVWILLTTKPAAMLPTVLSRCQPVAFAPLTPALVTQILQEVSPDLTEPQRYARYSGGSVTGAYAAARALLLLEENAWNTPAGPAQVAGGLSRTAALARQEAQAVLDVLIRALYQAWAAADETRRPLWQGVLQKMEYYKRMVGRNVSPALVVETALMSLDGLNVEL